MNPDAWGVVSTLGSAIRGGDSTLEAVPALLKRLLREEMWREFLTPRKQVVRYDRFEEFLTTPPTAGLGTSYGVVRRLLGNDVEALDLLDQAMQRSDGRPQETVDIVNSSRPGGNCRDQALRRLRKDRPDLHAEVLAERMSAHAAMVQAGLRPRTITVRVDDPARAAAVLARNFDTDACHQLATLLLERTASVTRGNE